MSTGWPKWIFAVSLQHQDMCAFPFDQGFNFQLPVWGVGAFEEHFKAVFLTVEKS